MENIRQKLMVKKSFKSSGSKISTLFQRQTSPRLACFLALLEHEKKQKKIEATLKLWQRKTSPKILDFHLAKEIALGVCKRKLTLDAYFSQLNLKKSLKIREKIILRMALYQLIFMDKIPFFAIVNESVEIAKKVISKETGAFFNALLRGVENKKLKPLNHRQPEVIYSYPHYFIELLSKEYGQKQAEDLLEIMNLSPKVFIRVRTKDALSIFHKEDLQQVHERIFSIFQLRNLSKIEEIKDDPGFYIQNVTQGYLIEKLGLKVQDPKSILDLCAAPGGKIIAAHDLYPDARLFANDVSEKRLIRLKENIQKYNMDVQISNMSAEAFHPKKTFDLVVVDAPCTNSGVLHRRAEARWAISKDHLHGLVKLQKEIIRNAYRLMSDQGKIWYMTCSILSEENEKVIEDITQELSLKIDGKVQKILPTSDGWDGGFGCVLKRA